MIVTSVCSSSECTQSTVLYGSTTAVAICGHAQVVKLSLAYHSPLIGVPTSNNQV